MSFPRTPFLVALALGIAALSARAQVPDPAPALSRALQPLEAFSTTGILYDRVLPLAHLERLDGSLAAPVMDRDTWLQACDELQRAGLAPTTGPEPEALATQARVLARTGVVPLGLLDRAFDRVRPGALADGSLRLVEGRAVPGPGTPLESRRALAVAAFAPRTFRGAHVEFVLDAALCSTDGPPPRALELDLADGLGFRPVRIGERVSASYATTGPRELTARVERADGSRGEARFAFEVAALATPSPDDTLLVTATEPYQGQYGTGSAYVYLAPGRTALVNPVIVVEGFDLDNSMGWDELYALLDQQDLIETLRADGYDAVVLDFTDATVAIEQNSMVVATLIQQVQDSVPPNTSVALVGASMGGLCSRYALAWMESHGVPHHVRTWISFDGPHNGADIPLGLQYWIDFFAGQSSSAASFLATLQRPAARELLLYHFTKPAGTTGQADPLRDSLNVHLAALGGWPTLARRVAIANGSGARLDQGFSPGAQLIRYEYSSLFVALTGNVWALPNLVSGTVFQGSLRILFSTTTETVTVSGTQPWDGAPGGWRSSMAQLDTTPAPYGDIVALHPNHCFIPTISALALPTTDPFFDVAGSVLTTPFDAVYYPSVNEEHVTISAQCAAWVRDEVEQGVLAVPGAGAGGGHLALGAPAPNPFARSTRVRFTLPRAGRARVAVFGVDGRAVRTLLDGPAGAGAHELAWDGRGAGGASVAAGIYFLRLDADGASITQRMVKIE